jgi:hypothetical protein
MNTGASTGGGVMLTVGIVAAFCIFFPLLWTGIVMFLSRASGWHGLAQRFACPVAPAGETHSAQSAMFGWARYKSTVTVTIADQGVHLALFFLFKMGHPPILIPWSEIESAETSSYLFFKTTRLKLRSGVTIDVWGGSAEPLKAAFEKRQPAVATT